MKASTYSILAGVWTLLVAVVIIPAPMAVITAAEHRSLIHFVVAAWIVFSILILARPETRESLEEHIVRWIAALIIFKCLLFLCWPDFLPWWIERLKASPNLARCFGLIDLLFSLWMFSLSRKLKRAAAQDSASDDV